MYMLQIASTHGQVIAKSPEQSPQIKLPTDSGPRAPR